MAFTMIRLVESERVEARTAFDGTGTAYFKKYISEDGAKTFWDIWGTGAPSTDYNDAPVGSRYTDITAGSVKLYIKTAASTWTVVGAQS